MTKEILAFWWTCTKRAFWGNTAFANDWQWVFGIPIVSGFVGYLASRANKGATEMTTGSPILDGFLTALGAFVITWIIAFSVRLLAAPARLYCAEKERADNLSEQAKPKIIVSYDRSIRPCRDEATFADGSKSTCFRLRVENSGTSTIRKCEGWLKGIREMPHLSPVKLFWIGMPTPNMSEDLPQRVPRYLQILRITDHERLIVATDREIWPLGEDNIFRPGKEYTFDIVVSAESATAVEFTFRFRWTGDRQTAELTLAE